MNELRSVLQDLTPPRAASPFNSPDFNPAYQGDPMRAWASDPFITDPKGAAPAMELPPTEQQRVLMERAMMAEAARPWFQDFVHRYQRQMVLELGRADAKQAYELSCQARVLLSMKKFFMGDLRRAERLAKPEGDN